MRSDTLSSSGAALSNALALQGTRQLAPLGCQRSCLSTKVNKLSVLDRI